MASPAVSGGTGGQPLAPPLAPPQCEPPQLPAVAPLKREPAVVSAPPPPAVAPATQPLTSAAASAPALLAALRKGISLPPQQPAQVQPRQPLALMALPQQQQQPAVPASAGKPRLGKQAAYQQRQWRPPGEGQNDSGTVAASTDKAGKQKHQLPAVPAVAATKAVAPAPAPAVMAAPAFGLPPGTGLVPGMQPGMGYVAVPPAIAAAYWAHMMQQASAQSTGAATGGTGLALTPPGLLPWPIVAPQPPKQPAGPGMLPGMQPGMRYVAVPPAMAAAHWAHMMQQAAAQSAAPGGTGLAPMPPGVLSWPILGPQPPQPPRG